jgi:ABC-2 type transport system permease protein
MNLAVVARTQWRVARRAMWSGGRPRRGVVGIVLAVMIAGAFSVTFMVLFGTLESTAAPTEVRARVLGWAFTFAFVLLALGDLLTVVTAAATAPDLERLLAAPLRARELLLVKFMETLSRTLGPVVSFALPAALCFAASNGGVGIFALLVALLTLWAVPIALGSALAMPLLRLAPAARLRESIAVLATLAFLGGWLANTFWMPRLLVSTDIAARLRAIPPPPYWSPATWAADALARPGERGLEALAACIGASVGALALALFTAERLLARLQPGAGPAPGTIARGSARRAPTLTGAFLRRDVALFSRDWPVLLDLAARLLLWTLLPLAVLPLTPMPPAELVRTMLVTLTLSLGNDIGTRALPLERHALAWARLSPVGGARWVRYRALGVAFLAISILFAGAALAGAALRLSPLGILDAFAFALPAAATAVGFGLLIGALLAEPEWRDPRAMLGPGGRTVSALVMLSQGAVWVAASHVLGPGPVGAGWLVTLGLIGAFVAWMLLVITARMLERREYTAR